VCDYVTDATSGGLKPLPPVNGQALAITNLTVLNQGVTGG